MAGFGNPEGILWLSVCGMGWFNAFPKKFPGLSHHPGKFGVESRVRMV